MHETLSHNEPRKPNSNRNFRVDGRNIPALKKHSHALRAEDGSRSEVEREPSRFAAATNQENCGEQLPSGNESISFETPTKTNTNCGTEENN